MSVSQFNKDFDEQIAQLVDPIRAMGPVRPSVARSKNRQRARRAAFVGVAGILGAGVVTVLSVVDFSPKGETTPALAVVLNKAEQQLQLQPGHILHYKLTVTTSQGNRRGTNVMEVWSASDAMRYVQTGMGAPRMEVERSCSYPGGAMYAKGRIFIAPPSRYQRAHPVKSGPGCRSGMALPQDQVADIIRKIRGSKTAVRTARMDGHSVYVLKQAANKQWGNTATEYYLDRKSFIPVRIHMDRTRGGFPAVDFRYSNWEQLPINSETRKLLSVKAMHPRAPSAGDPRNWKSRVKG